MFGKTNKLWATCIFQGDQMYMCIFISTQNKEGKTGNANSSMNIEHFDSNDHSPEKEEETKETEQKRKKNPSPQPKLPQGIAHECK